MNDMKKTRVFTALSAALLAAVLAASCDYGQVGGAGKTQTAVEMPSELPGVWYSLYGGQRTDGYTIGLVKNMTAEVGADKIKADFPAFALRLTQDAVSEDDYYIYYDDLGGYGGQTDIRYGFIGIVKRVNRFVNSEGGTPSGAVIFEYLQGCYASWTDLSKRPFMAMYYRVKDNDTIQMANPIDLAKLNEWVENPGLETAHYAVETATLAEAVAKFTSDNGDEFVNWGVTMPQIRFAQ